MKRTLFAFLMICLLSVTSWSGVFVSAAVQKPERQAMPINTAAEGAQAGVAAEELSLELFMPESYEQYLELENPSDFAINENYIAVADRQDSASRIYIYDKAAQAYRVFDINGQSPKSLNFYTKDSVTYLYFVLSDNNVFRVNLSEKDFKQEKIEGFTCFSLTILGETIYSSRTQGDATIYRSSIDAPTETERIQIVIEEKPEDSIKNCNNPVFAIFSNDVYLAANTKIYVYNGNNFVPQGNTVNIIDSFAVYNASPLSFYYTAGNGSLYQRISEKETRLLDNADYFSELVYFDGNIFLLNLQNYSVSLLENGALGGYEIGKYSDIINRIGKNAADISIYDSNLLIADTNNNRTLIAQTQSGSVIETPVTAPTIVCAGEENFVVSDSHYLYLYGYDGKQLHTFPASIFGGTISGCTYSYGKYYVVGTGPHANGVIEKDKNGTFIYTPSKLASAPTAVTSDIFGNIYVLVGTSVSKYSATSFIDGTGDDRPFYAPAGTVRILSDHTGKMYAATADGIYQLDRTTCTNLLPNSALDGLVYSQASPVIFSFAFGFEDNTVYILSNGFIAKADLGANAPATLKNIDATGLYDSLHGMPAESDAENMLVTVPAGSVVLPVSDMGDISAPSKNGTAAKSAEIFPYTSYFLTAEDRIGVRICTFDAGTVVAFYEYKPAKTPAETPLREYTVALVLDDKHGTQDDVVTLSGCYDGTPPFTTGYTTNKVGLYRFPLMKTGNKIFYSGELADRLEKSVQVKISGTISCPAEDAANGFGLDFKYYFVSANIGGKTIYGFIPADYILDFNTSHSWENTEFSFLNVKRGETIVLRNGENVLELSNEEQVKVYGEPNGNNEVYVTYTTYTENNKPIVWSGFVNADLLYEANPSTLIILAVVAVVTASVLVSTCYLILRKQPTMQ